MRDFPRANVRFFGFAFAIHSLRAESCNLTRRSLPRFQSPERLEKRSVVQPLDQGTRPQVLLHINHMRSPSAV